MAFNLSGKVVQSLTNLKEKCVLSPIIEIYTVLGHEVGLGHSSNISIFMQVNLPVPCPTPPFMGQYIINSLSILCFI
jgi:hypothetical protein